MNANLNLQNIFLTCLTLCLLNLFSVTEVMSQARKMSVSVNINLKVDTVRVRVFNPNTTDENKSVKSIVFKMKYGESVILNPKDADVLSEAGVYVTSVDIVYTDFHKIDVQDILNRKRITELYFLCPELFTQSMIRWRYVQQLGYTQEEDAKRLFHGIVVKYIKVPVYKPKSWKEMVLEIKNRTSTDTNYYKVLAKTGELKNELICADLTGSMSPYYFQLFAWLSLKGSKSFHSYAFFNDGDNAPDYSKKTGNVGGVYLFNTNSIDSVTAQAYNCISNGSGGDAPENNIEAALKGIKKFPEVKKIIMLVDNWADMRDYSLISELKIPVKVIVCGVSYMGITNPVNPQYLDLARRTNGSLHTIEDDIADLATKKEGEVFHFSGNKYVLRSGRFVLL
jgi:hypothetical protein